MRAFYYRGSVESGSVGIGSLEEVDMSRKTLSTDKAGRRQFVNDTDKQAAIEALNNILETELAGVVAIRITP